MAKETVVFECGGPNPFTTATTKSMITVTQQLGTSCKLFTVTYGLQVKADLSYNQACKELGECILHLRCCEFIASNEGL